MRDLTKSAFSLSWALSLFGLKQVTNILAPREGQSMDSATRAFEAVTEKTEEQLTDSLRATYRAGDNLQRGLVDAMFSFMTPLTSWTRDRSGRAASRGGDDDRFERPDHGAPRTSGARRDQEGDCGWGPMPPSDRGARSRPSGR
jgi:hypothetical protein